MWGPKFVGGGVWTNSLNSLTPKSVLELFSVIKIFNYFLIYELEKLVYMAANGLIGKYVHGITKFAYFRKTQQL